MPSANCFSIGKLESVENSMNAEANKPQISPTIV